MAQKQLFDHAINVVNNTSLGSILVVLSMLIKSIIILMLSSANWLLRILIFQLIFSYMKLVSYDMGGFENRQILENLYYNSIRLVPMFLKGYPLEARTASKN